MSDDFPSPEQHAQGWQLICDREHSEHVWVDASDASPGLLLAPDSQGEWWAVTPRCRYCGAALAGAFAQAFAQASAGVEAVAGIDEIACSQCGTAHGPGVANCECVALMVVEDEIYAAPTVG